MINNISFPALGINLTINRIAFTVFGIDIYWYGIIASVAMLAAFCLMNHLAKKKGINEDHLIDVIMIGTVFAIICARAYYVIFSPYKYDNLWDMINIRDGGIAIYGGIIGAFVFGSLACKWRKIDILELCDITAICFLLGQGIGRWANFVNQEAFGTNTTLPWGMISEGTTSYLQFVSDKLLQQGIVVDPFMPVHPTFLYESIWCLIGLCVLLAYYNRRKFKGEMLCLYLAWYGFGRFFIEGLRTDSLETNGGLRTSQLVALVTILIAIGIIIYMHKKSKNLQFSKINIDQNVDAEYLIDQMPSLDEQHNYEADNETDKNDE